MRCTGRVFVVVVLFVVCGIWRCSTKHSSEESVVLHIHFVCLVLVGSRSVTLRIDPAKKGIVRLIPSRTQGRTATYCTRQSSTDRKWMNSDRTDRDNLIRSPMDPNCRRQLIEVKWDYHPENPQFNEKLCIHNTFLLNSHCIVEHYQSDYRGNSWSRECASYLRKRRQKFVFNSVAFWPLFVDKPEHNTINDW